MQGAVPTVFAGLMHSASTPAGAERVFGMLSEGGVSGLAGQVAGAGKNDPEALSSHGQGLVGKIFGDKSGAVAGALAESSGVKGGSASHMLALVTPLVAGVVGKEIFSRHLDAGGMSKLLLGHNPRILSHIANDRRLDEVSLTFDLLAARNDLATSPSVLEKVDQLFELGLVLNRTDCIALLQTVSD